MIKEMQNFLELDENKDTIQQNYWHTLKPLSVFSLLLSKDTFLMISPNYSLYLLFSSTSSLLQKTILSVILRKEQVYKT